MSELDKVIKEIDNKATNKLMNCYNNKSITLPVFTYEEGKNITVKMNKDKLNKEIDILKNIMAEGCSDFEKKTGRPMSYSEMRQAYG